MPTPHPNAFCPVRSAAGDDDFTDAPEVRRARILLREQKQSLRVLVGRVIGAEPSTNTHSVAQDIATLLHNISGTAAYFGDKDFGRRARDLERPIRLAFTAGLMAPLCGQVLALLE